MTSNQQFDRSVRFLGIDGQEQIAQSIIIFAGVGGLGSFAVLEGALLHPKKMILIDPGIFKKSNRNRYATAWHGKDIGKQKVELGKRLVESINPEIEVETIFDSIISENGISAMKEANLVIGSFDNEASRLLTLQATAGLGIPYIDLATEILPGPDMLRYGGRVVSSFFGSGCLACLDILDRAEAGKELASDGELANRREIYGVAEQFLGDSGPSVGPLNGVVASVGMVEAMVYLSGLRPPQTHLNFDGRTGKVAVRHDRRVDGCYFCDGLFPNEQELNVNELINCEKRRAVG